MSGDVESLAVGTLQGVVPDVALGVVNEKIAERIVHSSVADVSQAMNGMEYFGYARTRDDQSWAILVLPNETVVEPERNVCSVFGSKGLILTDDLQGFLPNGVLVVSLLHTTSEVG
jgi:hypothetical protein